MPPGRGLHRARTRRALDVLGHVGQGTRFGTLLLEGAQPAWAPVEPPGAAVDGTPGEWWEQLADQARTAVAGADLSRVLDSPRGQRSIAEGLSFPRPRPVRSRLGHRQERRRGPGPARRGDRVRPRGFSSPSPLGRCAIRGFSRPRSPLLPVPLTHKHLPPGPAGTRPGLPDSATNFSARSLRTARRRPPQRSPADPTSRCPGEQGH